MFYNELTRLCIHVNFISYRIISCLTRAGVQAYFCLNKDFTKKPFSDQTGKGEKGWGIFMQEVLVAERPKQSDMSHSAIICV